CARSRVRYYFDYW
nr:immunoglobulin heavy chain junction region [Mus musculus]